MLCAQQDSKKVSTEAPILSRASQCGPTDALYEAALTSNKRDDALLPVFAERKHDASCDCRL
jgi:hypothetical protein